MTWNWEKDDWPDFRFDSTELVELENQFLRDSGTLLGAFKHLDSDARQSITVQLISEEALKTSEIEGEFLNRESLQSSVRQGFGLQADGRKASLAEQGVAEMMIDVYFHFDDSLDHRTLFKWHKVLLRGRKDIKEKGCYRTNPEPMQIISGPLHNPRVHFEAPPSKTVPDEMDDFIEWFNDSKQTVPILTRAGMAHAYFVSIHPFEDGNGRIGRALSEKAMAEKLGKPTLIALAQTIEKNKKNYYDALKLINRSNEVTAWLGYFANLVLEAQASTIRQVEFVIAKAKFYDLHGNNLNSRQSKAIKRIFREGPGGFVGGLSAENYLAITKTSRATATRDLADLLAIGALTKKGQLKHTRYYLKVPSVPD